MPSSPQLDPRYRHHFLGWTRPALHSAAECLLDAGGRDGVADLSGVVVALPGGRAGRRLSELLLDEGARQGLAVVPPRIVTSGGLPELFYRPEAPPPPPLVIRRAWAAALGTLSAGELRTLMSRPPGDGDPPSWFALAGTLDTLHRELAAERLTFREVAAACGAGLLFDDAPRWELLARVQENALERMERSGWLDRELARVRALQTPWSLERSPALPGALWLVALPELPKVVREFLAFAPCELHVAVNAPPEEAEGFDPDGTLRTDRWVDRPVSLNRVSLHVVGGPADQAEAVAQELERVAAGAAPSEVVVGFADPGLLPFLRQRLDRAGVRTRAAEGMRAEHTPLARLLLAAAEHLDGGRAESFATLVRHPDLESWIARGGLPAGPAIEALDRYRERHLPPRVTARPLEVGVGAEGSVGDRTERLRLRLETLLAPLRPERPLEAWAAPVETFLEAIYGDRALHEERPADRALLELIPRVRDLLRDAGADAGDGGVLISGGGFLRVLVELLRGSAVPPLPEEGAVELLGWLELPLDDAPWLLLAGVNEPHLPEAVIAHPFLPDALRERLGIPDNRHRRARDGYLLQAALAPRRGAVLVAGRRGPEGDPLHPSRLLLTGDPGVVADRILGFFGDEPEEGGRREPIGPSRTPRGEAAPEPALRLPPEPLLALNPGPIKVPISSFITLIRSPYEWVLSRLRGLTTAEEGAVELSPAAFGSLLHDALEALGRELAEETDPDRLEAGLLRALDGAVARRFGARPLASVRVQAAMARHRLAEAARVEARERTLGWRIRAVEAALPAEGIPFPAGGREFRLVGRVDRVDSHADGRWRLLDYKTGERTADPEAAHRVHPRTEPLPRWVDLQLPLYHRFASKLLGADGAPLGIPDGARLEVGYFTLPRKIEGVEVRMAAWSAEELESALVAARAALEPLAGDHVAFDPLCEPPRVDSPLAPLFGVGILTPALDEEEEGEG